jgi:uncharacterized membrane protein
MNKLTTASLAAALLGAVSLVGLSAPAQAEDVKCYGIAKSGENDCANAAGTHACAGMATENFDGGDWKAAASPHACAMHGGMTEPFEGMNPMKKSG